MFTVAGSGTLSVRIERSVRESQVLKMTEMHN